MPARSHRAVATPATSAALRVLGLVSLALTLPTETLPLLVEWGRASHASIPGLALLLASQIGSAIALLSPRQWRVSPWLLLLGLAGGLGWALGTTTGYDPVPYLIPGYWFFPLAIVAMRRVLRREQLGFVVIGTTIMVAVSIICQGASSREDWLDILWIIHPAVVAVLYGDALLALAQSRALAAARRKQAVLAQAELAGEVLEARSLLAANHRRFIHALRTIATAQQSPWSGANRIDVPRDACRMALDAADCESHLLPSGQVEDLIAADPALAEANGIVRGRGPALPESVAGAMAAAAHEALTNVTRHSRSNSSWVWVRSRDAVVVEISDAGRGFNPLRRVVDRMGADGAIVQQMDDVGGVAQIVSSPGHGTSVTLTWPRPRGLCTNWLAAPQRTIRSSLVLTVWPALVTAILTGLLSAPDMDDPWPNLAIGLVAAALAATAALAMSSRPPQHRTLLALTSVAFLMWGINVWTQRTDPPLDYVLWGAWIGSAIVKLIVLSLRRRAALVLATVWCLTLAVGLMSWNDPWGDLWEHSFVLLAGAGSVAAALLVIQVAQRTAWEEAEASRTNSLLRAATARLQETSQRSIEWHRQLFSDAVPLIAQVADGSASPADDQVRERARELAEQLSREYEVGTQHFDVLLGIAEASQTDWRLTNSLSGDAPAATLAEACTLLEILGDSAEPGQQVTLSSGRGRTLAVVDHATADQQTRWREALGSLEGTLDVQGDQVRLALTTHPAR